MHCKWSSWTQWSICSKSCGSGSQERVRKAKNGSNKCMGRKRDRRSCNKHKCPASKFGKNVVYSSKSHEKRKKK